MKILNSGITARSAARLFARTAFERPRQVADFHAGSRFPVVARFQLKGRDGWYYVAILPDFRGWDIRPADEAGGES